MNISVHNNAEMVERRIDRIDFFRFIMCINVVANHTHPFQDILESLNTFMTLLFLCIAVPFFYYVADILWESE
ncbi:hypothetical protein SAMN04487831_103317 [Pseudobutyrivibrio sp. UC1225]|nr:hypothetical protein SAMN04487831_103317 [Pseudobutyrivibrio sp. UC1225]